MKYEELERIFSILVDCLHDFDQSVMDGRTWYNYYLEGLTEEHKKQILQMWYHELLLRGQIVEVRKSR